MADSDLARCLHEVEITVKDKKIYVNSYTCTRIFAELKYRGEVVKTTIKDKLLKQSTFYKETRDEGMSAGREERVSVGRGSGVRSVLAARFGSVSDRLSGRIYSIMERNGSLFDDMIKLAATAKDMREFEWKLDRMA